MCVETHPKHGTLNFRKAVLSTKLIKECNKNKEHTPKNSHIIIFNWYIDVEPETFKLIEFVAEDFRERLEVRRSGSEMDPEASKIDRGASLPRTRTTRISSSQ